MNSKISMPLIASILVFSLFFVGFSFDDAEAKTIISENIQENFSVSISATGESNERGNISLSTNNIDENLVWFYYSFRNYDTGANSVGYGTFERDLIFTGNLKKKISINLNTADLDLQYQIGDHGLIDVSAKKDGKLYSSQESEEYERCDIDKISGIETCELEQERNKQKSGAAKGTIFNLNAQTAFFSEDKYVEKIWTNP